MDFMYYRSGTYSSTSCDPSKLNHAMLAVGYGVDAAGQDYIIVKNSWGTSWGDRGYAHVLMTDDTRGMCGIYRYGY